jgi:hypothetical protein
LFCIDYNTRGPQCHDFTGNDGEVLLNV